MIDNSRLVLYNNEIVKVSLFSRKGAKEYHGSKEEIRNMMLRHARMQLEFKGEYLGIREMRKHTAWYTKGMTGSARLRDMVNQVETYEELEALLTKMITGNN